MSELNGVCHRLWIPTGGGGEVMIDVADVVGIMARKMPGAWRDLPGGRREQGPASYDVTFHFRSGRELSLTFGEESWLQMRAAVRGEVAP